MFDNRQQESGRLTSVIRREGGVIAYHLLPKNGDITDMTDMTDITE